MRTATQTTILVLVFCFCTGLTIGLTFAPCYASLCTEEFFPRDTRLHIAVYYALIASIAAALFARLHIPACKRLSAAYLTKREVPIFKARFTVGGVCLAFWIVTVVLVTTAFWIGSEVDFWAIRTTALDWSSAQIPLVVTGIIGHHADMLLGLLLIPVGRNSLLVKVFGLSYGTLLYAHKLLAYLTVIAVFAHGVAYTTFWRSYNLQPNDSPQKLAFEINNPTLTVAESSARGSWSQANLGSGLAAFLLMLIIIVTALPFLRRQAYNIFYYTHIVAGCLIFVGACVHVSTVFYFLLPGLLLWIIDWARRLFGGESGLSREVTATVSPAGKSWYRITLPVATKSGPVEEEKMVMQHPLQTYYINIPSISRIENHAFTAAKVASGKEPAVLLFQKTPQMVKKRTTRAQDKEWTWRLSRLIDDFIPQQVTHAVEMRIEGPYIPVTNGFESADHVICLVGGTGLTGAYSIARWWLQQRSCEPTATFTLIWTARQPEAFQLHEWAELCEACKSCSTMTLISHCSSAKGRLDIPQVLREVLAAQPEKREVIEGNAWVYTSGPNALLRDVSDACIDMEAELRLARKDVAARALRVTGLSHYTADWEV